ncbi:substance-K receptor-like [Oculina patagonica]
MANDTSNSRYEEMYARLPASDCIPWLVVFITECLAIVILNIITIIVFVKQRQLQRRSTYLIIHLAIVDLLAGAVSGPLIIETELGKYCDLWEYDFKIWSDPLRNLFPTTSIVNLALLSLERLYATFRPFKHRLVEKWVYGVIVAGMWLITTSREIVQVVLYQNRSLYFATLVNRSLVSLYWSVCLLVFCISSISIFIKVRCSPHPQHHCAANRERKLTVTLGLVTLVSELCWLPYTIFGGVSFFHKQDISSLSMWSYFHIRMTLIALAATNSLANPIVYAARMPEFRTGLAKIFRRDSNRIIPAGLPLENLQRRQ